MEKNLDSGEKNYTPEQSIQEIDRAIEQLRNIFESTHKTSELSEVKRIKKLAIFSYNAVLGHYGASYPFSQAMTDHMINLAVVLYLEKWLEDDKKCRQNLYAFAGTPYRDRQRELRKKYDTSFSRTYYKALQRSENVLYNMQKQRAEQAIQEKSSIKSWPNMEHQRREHDFITLRFLELYANGRLALFRLLALRMELMGTISNKKNNQALIDAYNEYDLIFEDAKKEDDDKKYVISCIQLRKFESAFRFHLMAKIAEYMLINKPTFKPHKCQNFLAVWGRYERQALFSSGITANEPFDVLLYDQEIPFVFGETDISASVMLWRNLLSDVFNSMLLLYPTKDHLPWSEEDFSEAAAFFKTDYPIVESYQSVLKNLKDPLCTPEMLCDAIRNIYKDLSTGEGVTLNKFRKVMKQNGRRKIADDD